jgi:epsin
MDFDSLKNQVSNLTLYDLKAGVRKVQNGKPGFKSKTPPLQAPLLG